PVSVRLLHFTSFPTRRSSDLGVWRLGFYTLSRNPPPITTLLPAADAACQHISNSLELCGQWLGRRKSTPHRRTMKLNAYVKHELDRKSTRLNSSHRTISYAVF